MKTTLELPDDLFRQTKALAALRGESLKDFVTTAIRAHLQHLQGQAGRQPVHRAWRGMSGSAAAGEAADGDQPGNPATAVPNLPIKRVSRRREGQDVPRDAAILQRTINRLRGGDLVRRGVYRFHTHEEADAWMTRQMASTHARRSSKTS
jgi:hypothetical protein